MIAMPKKMSPSPMTTVPLERTESPRPKKEKAKPAATSASAYSVTSSAMIWAVTVVPMLAPMITPAAWVSVISPEVTNPTTRTVVTDED